ncbi:MAG: hypothetical protein ACMUEM_02245 [Flavobacteriales bacterium AspAUS03]
MYHGYGTPVYTVSKTVKAAGLKLSDIKLIELNEIFHAQSLVIIRELNFNTEIININCGAIALGYFLSCTGTKISV